MTHDEPPAEAERPRPVGGAAAWRRHDEPPVRAADDHLPEKVRYRHASLAEQLTGGIRELLSNRSAMAIIAIVFGGFVIFRLLEPAIVTFGALAPGDCLYVRAGDPASDRPIGPPGSVRERLLSRGAERAPCDLSHSHEVARVVDLSGAGDAWPGDAAVVAEVDPVCRDARTAIAASRPPGAPGLEVAAVVPDGDRWSDGARRGVCLVHRADGQFLNEHVLAP